jgi:hypothetical protein
MIGVARLHYRPWTARTSDWYRDLVRDAATWGQRYRDLLETAKNGSGTAKYA